MVFQWKVMKYLVQYVSQTMFFYGRVDCVYLNLGKKSGELKIVIDLLKLEIHKKCTLWVFEILTKWKTYVQNAFKITLKWFGENSDFNFFWTHTMPRHKMSINFENMRTELKLKYQRHCLFLFFCFFLRCYVKYALSCARLKCKLFCHAMKYYCIYFHFWFSYFFCHNTHDHLIDACLHQFGMNFYTIFASHFLFLSSTWDWILVCLHIDIFPYVLSGLCVSDAADTDRVLEVQWIQFHIKHGILFLLKAVIFAAKKWPLYPICTKMYMVNWQLW